MFRRVYILKDDFRDRESVCTCLSLSMHSHKVSYTEGLYWFEATAAGGSPHVFNINPYVDVSQAYAKSSTGN